MTYKELIKALERMSEEDPAGFSSDILDLINRQQAEIERLEKELNTLTKQCYKAGIKDFAERLKDKKVYSTERHENIVPVAVIDWTVKEMTEGV